MSHKPDSEADFFKQAMNDVRPLKSDKVTPYKKKQRPVPVQRDTDEDELDEFGDAYTDTPDFLDFKRAGIQNRLYQDLQRGVLQPAATLDLHGMRVVDARRALAAFLKHSLESRHRCIRIIHGKGRRSTDQQSILKQKVNQWLPQKDEVLAYCAAPRWDGGTGAAYVLLSLKWGR